MGTTESTMGGGGGHGHGGHGAGKGVNKGPFTDAEYALVVQVYMWVGVCIVGNWVLWSVCSVWGEGGAVRHDPNPAP